MGFTLPPPPMEAAQSLMTRKDAIQIELDSQFAILSANNSTLHTPLVDPEGFPRADIDVYAVRHARVRIIELRNDLESTMNDLAKALEGVYDPRKGGNVSEEALNSDSKIAVALDEFSGEGKVFARVDGVAPGSPAAHAGLLREDFILQFGTLDSSSFPTQSLQPLADLVTSHENRTLELVVIRKESQKRMLQLIPRKWGGRGLLGCHIIPFTP